MHPPATLDRRHTKEQVGFLFFGRYYSLAKIGAGLVFASSVIGIIGGCFAWGMQVAGQRFVSTRGEQIDNVADTAIAGLRQSRRNAEKVDSMAISLDARVHRLEDIAQMLGEIQCRQIQAGHPTYFPQTCVRILRDAAQ